MQASTVPSLLAVGQILGWYMILALEDGGQPTRLEMLPQLVDKLKLIHGQGTIHGKVDPSNAVKICWQGPVD